MISVWAACVRARLAVYEKGWVARRGACWARSAAEVPHPYPLRYRFQFSRPRPPRGFASQLKKRVLPAFGPAAAWGDLFLLRGTAS